MIEENKENPNKSSLILIMGENKEEKIDIVEIMLHGNNRLEQPIMFSAPPIQTLKYNENEYYIMNTSEICENMGDERILSIIEGIQAAVLSMYNKQLISHIKRLFILHRFSTKANFQFIREYVEDIFGASILKYITFLISNYEELILEYPDEMDQIKEIHLNKIHNIFDPETGIVYLSLFPNKGILEDIYIIGENIYNEVIEGKDVILNSAEEKNECYGVNILNKMLNEKRLENDKFMSLVIEHYNSYIDPNYINMDQCKLPTFNILTFYSLEGKLIKLEIGILPKVKGGFLRFGVFNNIFTKLSISDIDILSAEESYIRQLPYERFIHLIIYNLLQFIDISFTSTKPNTINLKIEIKKEMPQGSILHKINFEGVNSPPDLFLLHKLKNKYEMVWLGITNYQEGRPNPLLTQLDFYISIPHIDIAKLLRIRSDTL